MHTTVAAPAAAVDFTVPDELAPVLARVQTFVDDIVIPAESQVADPHDVLASWSVVEELRNQARRRGIFVPHLPSELGGLGIGMIGMAMIHEICGASALGALALNAMAPDEGNMHTLMAAASQDQRDRYLEPLAEGRLRSCFAMTEPDVASSDPLNLQTEARRTADGWVLSGRKWFITGGVGADFAIVVARTGPPELRHKAYSLFVVDCDAPGFEVVRDPGIIGAHFVGGHPELELRDVEVDPGALLGPEGGGFALAQGRLAGGRLAHAMRWIGTSQRALDLAVRRLDERQAFGRPLADHQALQFFVADSAVDLYAARLMVLHTAWKVERGLPHRQEVAMTKTFVSEAFGRVLDRAVQIFGSHGIATDLPIAQWWADARAARIYDGASEVHRMVIARELLRFARAGRSTRAGCAVTDVHRPSTTQTTDGR